MPHQLDVLYKSLKADLTLLDPSSHEHQVIMKYIEFTKSQWTRIHIQHVWKVNREKAVSEVPLPFLAVFAIQDRISPFHLPFFPPSFFLSSLPFHLLPCFAASQSMNSLLLLILLETSL